MSKIGLPRVASILEARRAAHEGDLAEASRLKAETDKAIASFEQALADAHANAEQIGAQTRDRLNAEIIAKRSSFDAELTANLDAEERTIAEAKARAMSNVGEIAAESALAIVGRLVGIEMPLQDARSAVDQFVKS
jgi:F-type H+-transporting ATPase subunit b